LNQEEATFPDSQPTDDEDNGLPAFVEPIREVNVDGDDDQTSTPFHYEPPHHVPIITIPTVIVPPTIPPVFTKRQIVGLVGRMLLAAPFFLLGAAMMVTVLLWPFGLMVAGIGAAIVNPYVRRISGAE